MRLLDKMISPVARAFFAIGIIFLPAYGLSPTLPPSGNFDLSAFKLQTLNKSLAVLEVPTAQLLTGYTDSCFYTDSADGSMVFRVPSNGKSTSNSDFPRCELRQMAGGGGDWKLTDTVLHRVAATCKVAYVGTAVPIVVIGQVHGSDSASTLAQIRWNGYKPGSCYVEAFFQGNSASRGFYLVTLVKGLSLGATISYVMTMKAGKVGITVNDTCISHTYTTQYYGATDLYYFKAGNYFQYSSTSSVYHSVVKFYGLAIQTPTSVEAPASNLPPCKTVMRPPQHAVLVSNGNTAPLEGAYDLFSADGRLVRRFIVPENARLSSGVYFRNPEIR